MYLLHMLLRRKGQNENIIRGAPLTYVFLSFSVTDQNVMIHIPQAFLWRERKKKEFCKPKVGTGNNKAGKVSYQGS